MTKKIALIFFEDGSHMFTDSKHKQRHPETKARGIRVEVLKSANINMNSYTQSTLADQLGMGLDPTSNREVIVVDKFSIKEDV